MRQVVLDTSVLVAGLRSRRGASFKVLSMIDGEHFQLNVSVALVLEYEAAAKRSARAAGLTHADVDDVVDYLCQVSRHRQAHFLWRPFLKDRKDDHVLELAVEAECRFIVTHNVRDFAGAEQFGIRIVTPREFLEEIGEIS